LGTLADTTAAVLVVYRPERSAAPLIEALLRQVRQVVVVDNSEQPAPGFADATRRLGAEWVHNANRGALAGAYNRALEQIASRWDERTAAQVVFVDEDSDVEGLAGFLNDPIVAARLADPRCAAVAPAYRDRATGLRGKYIELGRWRLRYLPRQFDGLREVAFVINSMSVWRRAALARIGPFDERLAIDHVDTEYCLRARRLGLSLQVHGAYEFAHSIGERRAFRLFGRQMQAGGHGPARRYLIGRNTAWLARCWAWREPAFAFLCISRIGYEAVGILLAEGSKWNKLTALLRGVLAGLFTTPSARPA